MNCPECGTLTKVINSRLPKNTSNELGDILSGAQLLIKHRKSLRARVRECAQCGRRWDTIEILFEDLERLGDKAQLQRRRKHT